MTLTPERLDEIEVRAPSKGAMEVAVKIELMVALGGYKTVAYAKAIQEAIDAALTAARSEMRERAVKVVLAASPYDNRHTIAEDVRSLPLDPDGETT